MALAKRPLVKEENIDQGMKTDDHCESIKRKKRSQRDDDVISHERTILPQKKRSLGQIAQQSQQQQQQPLHGPLNRGLNNNLKQNEDQDDETLIRETQAALKSLSGSWPDSRGSLYKLNDQDENPSFQNLFEEKSHHDSKMSPSSSSVSSNGPPHIDSQCNLKDVITLRDCNGKNIKIDSRNAQKIKSEHHRGGDKTNDQSISQYHPPDFNELVDDSSSDLQIDIDDKDGQNKLKRDLKLKLLTRDDSYPNYPKQFSQVSAFKPPNEIRKNGLNVMPGPIGSYSVEPTYIGYPAESQTTIGDPSVIPIPTYSSVENKTAIKIKVEEAGKSIGSPDSKQYTILQPAGIGSRAASVMQDIAREGVVSVSAVSSTSSPGIGIVSSSTQMNHMNEKIPYDRPIPALSPGSINRGKFILIINNFLIFYILIDLIDSSLYLIDDVRFLCDRCRLGYLGMI